MILLASFRKHHRLKSFWNAVLGIASELLLALAIIVVSLAVCVFWWGLFR